MGISDKLATWLSSGVVEVSSYRCSTCGEPLDDLDAECSECGDEEVEVVEEPIPVYWELD